MTTMTVPPPSPTHGRRLHQGHAGPFDKPLATRSLRNNNNDIFEDAQRMHSWRDRFLELCGLHGRDTERDGSSLLNILHTKLYLDKWEATFLGPSIGLEQLRKVLLYIEKILATSEAHRTGKKCVYSLDYCAFQDLRILRRLQRESPALESQHLHQIRLSCSECAPLQPRLLFDDFPSNATHHEHLTLPAWQPPDEQLLDDANDIFYSTISRHSMCKLPDDHTRHHVGRLQLLDAVDPVADPQNREIVYQTVFHGSAHEASDQVTSLMRLKFHVSSEHNQSSRVGFSDESGARLPPIDEAPQRPLRDDLVEVTLCDSLVSYIGPVSISLHVTTANLYGSPGGEPGQELTDDGDSLMALITGDDHGQKYDLSDEGKLFLASQLAFAVWQYYNSRWMACSWTAHTIHFLREHLGDTDLNSATQLPLKPYIQMHFEDPGTLTPEPRPAIKLGMLHSDPKISTLGVVLAVIFWGPLSTWTNVREMNEMCRSNREIVECKNKTKRDLQLSMNSVFPIEENIREVVEACLDHQAVRGLTEHERRAYLLENVVSPLQSVISALKVSGFSSCAESWRQTTVRHEQPADTGEDSVSRPSPARPSSPTTGSKGSTNWINSIRSSTLSRDVGKLYRGKKKEARSRIKIAILDTGYLPERLDKSTDLQRVHWKDFVANDAAQPCDASADSHGSTILQLVKRIAPDAEIFVARIARVSGDLRDISPRTGDAICKAIRWAAIERHADIITMSFGFENVHHDISYTIDEVVRQREQYILLLAAAGNEGKNSDTEFPASHRDVFSVHSTDHNGNYSAFDTGLKSEIAILGENIEGIPSVPLVSGTSFATPIVAAICALVLDAARDCASDNHDLSKIDAIGKYRPLCTLKGMEKFLSLQPFTPQSHKGSRCLDPCVFSSYDRERRLKVLDYVVELICAMPTERSTLPR